MVISLSKLDKKSLNLQYKASPFSTTLLVHRTTSTMSTNNLLLYMIYFSLLSHYIFTKLSLQSKLPLPSSIYQSFLTSQRIQKAIFIVSTKNAFPYLIRSANLDYVKGRENLMSVDIVLIFPCFPER